MRIYLILLLTFIGTHLFSQDILILRNGGELEATVSKVTLTAVEYTSFNSQDSTINTIDKSEVFLIKYNSGVVSYINTEVSNIPSGENAKSDTPLLAPYDGSQIAGVVGTKYVGLGISTVGVLITTENPQSIVGPAMLYGGSLLYTICQIIQDVKTAVLGRAVGDLYEQERRRFGPNKKKKNINDPAHDPEWEFVDTVIEEETVELGPLKLTAGCKLLYTNKNEEEFDATLQFYNELNEYYFLKYIDDGRERTKIIYPKNYNKIRLAE